MSTSVCMRKNFRKTGKITVPTDKDKSQKFFPPRVHTEISDTTTVLASGMLFQLFLLI